MEIVVAGGHGKVGRRLLALLAREGHTARGLVRNPDHRADLEAVGAAVTLADLERDDLTDAVRGADAVVFAAGAGPGSGPERKRTVDLGGAVRLLAAARAAGVDRYVMVSSMGADRPPEGDDGMGPYLRAKAEADAAVIASDRSWTIVRPGGLTDDPGTGCVTVGRSVPRGSVSRDDVAAVLAAVLLEPATAGLTFELVAGETPVDRAVRELAGA
ncbi:MAG: oxidoreductase ylbE [uncultured Thermoleophilia bacterium]|uniref:Oxidoreductase ylbE n=1 Tax=uncultured Thermoleophilia bacterium TaxID=1497501 RepID=A0A6J4UAQ4_9ACTN|nr:MAG: oxidoreductase ylbE [uncultured Thermoleophilia bacterium]